MYRNLTKSSPITDRERKELLRICHLTTRHNKSILGECKFFFLFCCSHLSLLLYYRYPLLLSSSMQFIIIENECLVMYKTKKNKKGMSFPLIHFWYSIFL